MLIFSKTKASVYVGFDEKITIKKYQKKNSSSAAPMLLDFFIGIYYLKFYKVEI